METLPGTDDYIRTRREKGELKSYKYNNIERRRNYRGQGGNKVILDERVLGEIAQELVGL